MTQYLLSVYIDQGAPAPDPEAMKKVYADVDEFNKKVQDAGAWVFGGGLEPQDVATVIRADNGETVTTDGPYAETKEYIGGFWIIEAPDLDAALDWAEAGSRACQGPVEVRPFQAE